MKRLKLLFILFICVSFGYSQSKKVLFDNTKAETAGNADWVIDDNQPIPSPAQSGITQSTTESYWLGANSAWGVDMVKLGYTVHTLTSTYGITYGNSGNPYDLSNYDLFIVCEPNILFTASEKQAILNYVYNGGGLMMVSDHNGSDRNNDGSDSPKIWNDLGSDTYFGIHFQSTGETNNNISQVGQNLASNPGDSIIHGLYGTVTGLSYHNGTTMNLLAANNPNATGHIWMNGAAQGSTQVMAATSQYGLGRVASVGDSSPADDGSAEPGNSSIFNGWTESGTGASDNVVFLNMCLWLSRRSTASLPPQCILNQPANSGSGIITPVNFRWYTASTATAYQLDVSTSNTFGSFTFSDSTLTDTIKPLSGLIPKTTYYWRVRAKNAAGWGQYSTVWSFATMDVPQQITLTRPTNSSVNITTPVSFLWRAASIISAYELDVSTSGGFSSYVFTDSTLLDTAKNLGGFLPNTTYYWRVRGKNVMGWGQYSTIWSYTTLGFPAQVSPAQPANGSINLLSPLTVRWYSVSPAIAYEFDLSSDNNFTSFLFNDTTLTDTTQLISNLSLNTQYYWRVRAKNAVGWGQFSTVWNFTTMGVPPQIVPIQPLNGSLNVVPPVNFSWHATSPVSAYELDVSTSGAFDQIQFTDSTLTDTVKQLGSFSPGNTYYWRVRAKDAVGWGGFSSTSSFTVMDLPAQVILIQPVNGGSNIFAPVDFLWRPAPGASAYELDISVSDTFDSFAIADTTVTDTAKNVLNLLPSTRYYWRVRAKDPIGWGSYSDVWSFTTTDFPPQINLTFPPNGGGNTVVPVRLAWSADSGISVYELDVSTSDSFNQFVILDSTLTDTMKTIDTLSLHTTYFWRVRGKNAVGWSAMSTVWSFTTWNVPGQVHPVMPLNGAVNVRMPVHVGWNIPPLNPATMKLLSVKKESRTSTNPFDFRYELDVSLAGDFSSIVMSDTTIIDTSATLNQLSMGTIYFWRVRSGNGAGWGAYSTVQSFSTWNVPFPVVLSTPPDSAEISGDSISFKWMSSGSVLGYNFELSLSSHFDSTIITDSSIIDTGRMVVGLDTGVIYYWHVRARDSAGWGGFSTTWRVKRSSLQTIGVSIPGGWNLVSVPFLMNDYRKVILFPGTISNAFAYEGSYTQKDTLKPGTGYWLKFNARQPIAMSGTPYRYDSLILNEGWNLIGSPTADVSVASLQTNPPGIIATHFFGYAAGYTITDSLHPMMGYWVKTSQSGTVFINSAPQTASSKASANDELKNFTAITFSDFNRHSCTLYATRTAPDDVLKQFELPPVPPEGVPDVRYSSGRIAEGFSRETSHAISLNSLVYPVTIHTEFRNERSGYSVTVDGKHFLLKNGNDLVLRSKPAQIILHYSSPEIPTQFILGNNYPNPFNPGTIIPFALPVTSYVRVTVVNSLGQEIAVLLDGTQQAGYKEIEWKAGNVPSGLYFIRLDAFGLQNSNQIYHATHKVVLIK